MKIPQKKQKISTVDEYISIQPAEVRSGLKQLRQIIKKAAPGAEEVISYGMPGFKLHGMLVWYAAAKEHYGFYPAAKAIQVFKSKLSAYELSKGTIRFPLDKPLPVKLISEIVKFRVKENLGKKMLKSK